MFDFPKALSAIADADSRLEQIANQQRVTNGLLALLCMIEQTRLVHDVPGELVFTPMEHAQLIALVRTAFNDKNATDTFKAATADQGMRFDAEGTLIESDQS